MSLPLPGRPPGFDRSRILASAARARAKRRRARAIDLYRWVLAVEPRNPDLHVRVAPLLAETGQEFDAWVSYQTAAQTYLRQGSRDKALAVYREATRYLPREYKAWQAVARLLLMAGRGGEAVETLVEGSRQFRSRWARPQAIYLLRRAREIALWDFETCLELALLLASNAQRREARLVLQGLALRTAGPELLRVRAAEFRAAPGPGTALRWLRCALGRAEAGDVSPAAAPPAAAGPEIPQPPTPAPAAPAAEELPRPAPAAGEAGRRPPARVTLLRPRRRRAGGDAG